MEYTINQMLFERPPRVEYGAEELATLALAFIKAHPGQGYTQKHIEKHFNDPEHYVPYAKAGRVLMQLAEEGEIVMVNTDDPHRKNWKPDGKKHKFYFYAPEKSRLDAAKTVEERRKIVKSEIKQYIFDNDDCSESMIRQAMVSLFIQMDINIIRECLCELRESGEVTTQQGARRAILHRLK